jgi:endogenous inhibitor of DNA gyrase (YacG/DUF329 family)
MAGPATIACPTCRRETAWEGNPWRPFCSERCRLIDLGAWAGGEYRIPSGERPADDDEGGDQGPGTCDV